MTKQKKKGWEKTLRSFEPEWYQDMEIMEAFIQSLLNDQREEMGKALKELEEKAQRVGAEVYGTYNYDFMGGVFAMSFAISDYLKQND